MKKSKNLLIFGLIPLMSLPVVAISCNNSNKTIANAENGFNPLTKWENKTTRSSRDLNIYNGNRNKNATEIIKAIVDKLNV
ncbi:MAG: variable surface lipoprotein, partial [Mycoplasmataceae bacterium]|nr:variable surface lipoprotein [Mycoplasmataceae bacterium]